MEPRHLGPGRASEAALAVHLLTPATAPEAGAWQRGRGADATARRWAELVTSQRLAGSLACKQKRLLTSVLEEKLL